MQIEQINNKILELSNDWEKCKDEFVPKKYIQELENKIKNMETIIARNYIPNSNIDLNSDLKEFIRFGEINNLTTKSLTSTDNEGGYLIQPALQKKIAGGIKTKSPIRQLASIESISTSSLEVVIEHGSFQAGWVAETVSRTITDNPTLFKRKIPVHELYSQPKATQKLLDDSAINIENWLIENLQDSFTYMENQSFIQGNGIIQPRGMLYKPEEYNIEIIDSKKENI